MAERRRYYVKKSTIRQDAAVYRTGDVLVAIVPAGDGVAQEIARALNDREKGE